MTHNEFNEFRYEIFKVVILFVLIILSRVCDSGYSDVSDIKMVAVWRCWWQKLCVVCNKSVDNLNFSSTDFVTNVRDQHQCSPLFTVSLNLASFGFTVCGCEGSGGEKCFTCFNDTIALLLCGCIFTMTREFNWLFSEDFSIQK